MKMIKLAKMCSSLSAVAILVGCAGGMNDPLMSPTAQTGAQALSTGSQGLQTLQNGSQALQSGSQALTGQAATAMMPGVGGMAGATNAVAGNGLTGMLMQQLGVSQPQAEGGAGAVFQMAKSRMQASAFSQLSNSVPGMSGLLAAAPAAQALTGGGMGGMAGGLAGMAGMTGMSGGSAGSMLGLASSFQQLGLSPSMAQRFIPIVLQYVQGSGGSGVSSLLSSALMGGL